jgi:serine/threonine protein kinase
MITKTEVPEKQTFFYNIEGRNIMSMGSTILHEELSKELKDSIIHCLAYDPADRPSIA